jgi:hypothetical protein
MTRNGRGTVPGWFGLAAAIVGFGLSFGFVEAAVVIDLRTVYEPLQQGLHPGTPADALFPAVTLDELRRVSPRGLWLLKVELVRELATMVMLAALGLAVGGRPVRRFAAFVAAFGIWDLAFYLWLRLLIGWPATVWTWDLLFLFPVPWSGPVLAPMIVAVTMTVAGLHAIARDAAGRPVRPSGRGWAALAGGALLAFLAFVENSRTVMAGGVPERFGWPLLLMGLLLAVAGYGISAAGGQRSDDPPVALVESGRGSP